MHSRLHSPDYIAIQIFFVVGLQVPASRLPAVAERFRAQDGGGHLLLPLCLPTAFAGPCRCRAL